MNPFIVLASGMWLLAGNPTSVLPDPEMTPGAINPDVTPDNIDQTICKPGWTKTVRPPEEYTEKLKREQIEAYGYTDKRLGAYEEDHLIPLELGGNPTDPRNLWPQPIVMARLKDRLEYDLNRLVCSHIIDLRWAQVMIAHDWWSLYKELYGAQTPDYDVRSEQLK